MNEIYKAPICLAVSKDIKSMVSAPTIHLSLRRYACIQVSRQCTAQSAKNVFHTLFFLNICLLFQAAFCSRSQNSQHVIHRFMQHSYHCFSDLTTACQLLSTLHSNRISLSSSFSLPLAYCLLLTVPRRIFSNGMQSPIEPSTKLYGNNQWNSVSPVCDQSCTLQQLSHLISEQLHIFSTRFCYSAII